MTNNTSHINATSTAPRARHHRRLLVAVAATLAAGGVAVSQSEPASAGANAGVHSVSLVDDPAECTLDDGSCPHGGPWASNTIHLFQSQVDGEWRFDTIVASTDDGQVRFRQDLGVDCEFGYHVKHATIRSGHYEYDGLYSKYVPQVGGLGSSFPVGGEPNAVSMSTDMLHPLEGVLQSAGFGTPDGLSDPVQGVLDYAEAIIQDRIDSGMSEFEARTMRSDHQRFMKWSVAGVCKGNLFGTEYLKERKKILPLAIVLHDRPLQPGSAEGAQLDLDFQLAPRVEQAELFLWTDPEACTVTLNPWFEANQEMVVEYRVVDNYGRKSGSFFVEIDHTLVSDDQIELPASWFDVTDGVQLGNVGTGWIVDGGGHDGAPSGDKAIVDNGEFSNVVHIEVVEPYAFDSNHVGFSMEPCDDPPADDDGADSPLRNDDLLGRATQGFVAG